MTEPTTDPLRRFLDTQREAVFRELRDRIAVNADRYTGDAHTR